MDDRSVAVRCTFCLKSSAEVGKMIAGPGTYICDECVRSCVDILDASPPADREQSRLPRWRSMPDEELLRLLPRIASVAAQVEGNLLRWVAEARRRGASWARIGEAMGMSRQAA